MAVSGTQLRQGDILVVAVNGLPQEVELIPVPPDSPFALVVEDADRNDRHCVTTKSVLRAFRSMGSSNPVEWIQVDNEGLRLTHPQHGTLMLEPGTWQIIRQREFDPSTLPRQRRD